MRCERPEAAAIPMTAPTSASCMPCQTTRLRMRERSAPRAMRKPISRALLHGVSHEAVDADGGGEDRGRSEDSEQEHVEVLARGGVDNDFFHRADAGDGRSAAGRAELLGDVRHELVRVCVRADEPGDDDIGVDAVMPSGTCA